MYRAAAEYPGPGPGLCAASPGVFDYFLVTSGGIDHG